MSSISVEYLQKCIETLECSYVCIKAVEEGSIEYEMYRNALVKGFEMTLEQSGKLLKKVLVNYFATNKSVDNLTFKELFRQAFKVGLLSEDEVNRWLVYRDNRNNTAHDYGREFAEKTLSFIEDFLRDAKKIKEIVSNA